MNLFIHGNISILSGYLAVNSPGINTTVTYGIFSSLYLLSAYQHHRLIKRNIDVDFNLLNYPFNFYNVKPCTNTTEPFKILNYPFNQPTDPQTI